MKKIKYIFAVILTTMVVLSSALNAGGNVLMSDDQDRYQDAIDEIKSFDGYSTEKLAEIADMSVEEFKKFTKIDKNANIIAVTPDVFRTKICSSCHNGRMINHGNKCLEYRNTGEQRPCTHYAYGTDIRFERTCQAIARCEICFYTISTEWKESKWECHGFSN